MSDTATTRTRGMKWVKLGEGEDPFFETEYFLTDGDMVAVGLLLGINHTGSGKKYSWNANGADKPMDQFTHYCEPILPK